MCAIDIPGRDILGCVTAIEDTDLILRIIFFSDDTAVAVTLENGDSICYSYDKGGYYTVYTVSHSAENISTQNWTGYVGNKIDVHQVALKEEMVTQALSFTVDLSLIADFNLSIFVLTLEFTYSLEFKYFAEVQVPLVAFPDIHEMYDVYFNFSNPLGFSEKKLNIGPIDIWINYSCIYSAQLFDATFRDPLTALKTFVTETTEVISKVIPKPLCEKTQPDLIWTMDKFDPPGTLIHYPVNIQNSTVATLLRQTIHPGLYRLSLTTVFFQNSDISPQNATLTLTDYLYLEFLLPDLVAIIEAGTQVEFDQTVPHQFDASSSHDPVTIPSVTIFPLIASWECYQTEADDVLIDVYIKNFPNSPDVGNIHNCTGLSLPQNNTIFTVPSSGFEAVNMWYLIVFTLSRENRSSSAIQAVKPVLGSPLKIKLR
ncbi:hypothetical protein CHS0354_028632 [Potamilus streckersoni]|uniref:PKD/REJ-like domain-containing protein n=1 Tax=Potamilus streckersoni TaxID=2493646 RepID=A0AAE0SWC2_9BIVA|nr:hypothetical protein CHS0354_028632 [Potamilus streckersoni]